MFPNYNLTKPGCVLRNPSKRKSAKSAKRRENSIISHKFASSETSKKLDQQKNRQYTLCVKLVEDPISVYAAIDKEETLTTGDGTIPQNPNVLNPQRLF